MKLLRRETKVKRPTGQFPSQVMSNTPGPRSSEELKFRENGHRVVVTFGETMVVDLGLIDHSTTGR